MYIPFAIKTAKTELELMLLIGVLNSFVFLKRAN